MTPKFADQAERLRNDFSAKETKIICISGGKGGVGKSLISVNVAVEIAKRGKSVLIFDSDAGFANASILLGKTLKNTLSDYINNNLPLEKCIQKTEYGVNVISTGFDFKDWKIYQSSFSPKMVEDLFLLSKDNDYVIVDIGAGYSETIKPFYLAAND
ncbi:MAG TPA: AAA family ATPase, partial [Petrotogaceae bacterium]|nr:AAA family ATPase [Petrotogaceae bacterium]